ncbi:MAG: T9SS type B sorting domain-containing protein, partial [Kaistella sp.]
LNNINFQSSNVITGIPRGLQKVYVRDAHKCATVEKELLIINLVNVITPNGDGFNDVLDYSDLKIKENVTIQIFDRFGNLIFTSKDQEFIWDGKLNGRVLPTANYWYILNWTEPDTQNPVSYKGWILLKNRN